MDSYTVLCVGVYRGGVAIQYYVFGYTGEMGWVATQYYVLGYTGEMGVGSYTVLCVWVY